MARLLSEEGMLREIHPLSIILWNWGGNVKGEENRKLSNGLWWKEENDNENNSIF